MRRQQKGEIKTTSFSNMQPGDSFFVDSNCTTYVQARIHRYKELFNKYNHKNIIVVTRKCGDKIKVERVF